MVTKAVSVPAVTVLLASVLAGCGGSADDPPGAIADGTSSSSPDVVDDEFPAPDATAAAVEWSTLEIPEAGVVMQFPSDRVDVSDDILPDEARAAGGTAVAWEWVSGDDYVGVSAFPDAPNPAILPIPRLLREGFRNSESGAAVVADASLTTIKGFPALVGPEGPGRFASLLREDDSVGLAVEGDEDGALFDRLVSSITIEGDAATMPAGWGPIAYPTDGEPPLTALLPPGAPAPRCQAGVAANTTTCGSSVAVANGTVGAFQVTGPGMGGALSDPRNDALVRTLIDLGADPMTVRQVGAGNDLRFDNEVTTPEGRTARITMFADDVQAVGVLSLLQGGDGADHRSVVQWLDW